MYEKWINLFSRRKIANGNVLKIIAIISMIIDHFGCIIMDGVIAPYQVNDTIHISEHMPLIIVHALAIKNVCNILGYIAFPIFCFMIAEGFMHTRNRVKYGLRIGFFALISEIPYDLAHYHKLFSFSMQNVMFTLCIGIFTLLAISIIEEHYNNKKPLLIVLIIITIAVGMGLAFVMHSEYVFIGVLIISLLYLLRNTGYFRMLAFSPILIVSPWALLAIIPLLLYNGKRGNGSKYFFYIFYPTHILLFAGISYMLSIR